MLAPTPVDSADESVQMMREVLECEFSPKELTVSLAAEFSDSESIQLLNALMEVRSTENLDPKRENANEPSSFKMVVFRSFKFRAGMGGVFAGLALPSAVAGAVKIGRERRAEGVAGEIGARDGRCGECRHS